MENILYDEKKYPKHKYPWTKAEAAFFKLKETWGSYKHNCAFKNHYGEQACHSCESYEYCQNAWGGK